MNFENLCVSCFKEKSGEYCEHCGFKEPEKAAKSTLPVRTRLCSGRYFIGETINIDKNSTEYKVLDTQSGKTVEIQEYFPREIASRNKQTMALEVNSADNTDAYRKNVMTIMMNARAMFEFADSPNIVNIYDCFEENNTVYIVKEYIEGMRLSDYVADCSGKLDTETALSIMVPVLDGLNSLHKAGLIHRALTPKCIIITSDNKIKISDFRFLKEASPYKDTAMTVHVTPGYAPPEQYRSKSKQGPFSDIYSAGAILYRILTGEKPTDALNRQVEDTLPDAISLNSGIPENVSVSIMKALELVTELRFKSASDFKNGLIGIKEVPDIDKALNEEKKKKFIRTTVILVAAVAAITAFILFKLNS